MKTVITIQLTELKDSHNFFYGYACSGQAFVNGLPLEGINHYSSNIEFARGDMVRFFEEKYDTLFPKGWVVEFKESLIDKN